jgi:hypothetical protein
VGVAATAVDPVDAAALDDVAAVVADAAEVEWEAKVVWAIARPPTIPAVSPALIAPVTSLAP